MSMNKDAQEFNEGVDLARDKVISFKKTRIVIKIVGVFFMFITLMLEYWLAAVLLWILFFPDLNDFVKFFKNYKKQNHNV